MAMDSRAAIQKIKDVFHYADHDLKGYLSRQDYKVAMVCLTGNTPLKWEVDQIFNTTPDNRLSADQFLKVANEQWKYQGYNGYIREMFRAFDRQWKGYLMMEDLVMAQQQTFPRLRKSLVQEAFYLADTDSDGRIGYTEFHSLLTANRHHI